MAAAITTKTPRKPVAEKVCAVVVTCFPDGDIVQRLARILEQVGSMIVVDNASSEETLLQLRELACLPTVELLQNSENQGIARALNQAAELAARSGAQWILSFDQDTVVRDDLLRCLIDVFTSSGSSAPIIGSNYWNSAKQRRFIRCSQHSAKVYVERKTVITSGTLLWLGLFQEIGGFREDYFIDSVDHEYCLRARTNGYRVLLSCAELMNHSIGDDSKSGRRFIAHEHSAIRKYYMTRNTLVTVREYFPKDPLWALCQIARLFAELLSVITLERDKYRKTRYYFRGVWDALAGRMGRIAEETR